MRNFIRNIYNSFPSGAIIMAHHVCDDEPIVPSCIISTENFKNYVHGKNIVPLGTMLQTVVAGAYVLTFDDSLDDLYTFVYPYLIDKEIPFTAFISASLIDQPGYITKLQLQEMAEDPLVTIGSHGCTHQHLSSLSYEDSRKEIFKSKEILESVIQTSVDYIAYPFGDASQREYKFAREAGYTYGFDVIPRQYNVLSKYCNRMKLPRINLTNNTFSAND